MPLVPHVTPGSVVASTWGNLVADHVVMRFTTAAQRTSQLTAPILNQLTALDNRPGVVQYWNGNAWMDQGPGELYTHEPTAPVPITNGSAAQSHLVAGGGAWTFDGSPVLIEFYAPQAQTGAAAGASLMLQLFDGATDLGYWGQCISPAAAVLTAPVNLRRRLVPTAGSHTYRVTAWVPTGHPGNIGMGPGGAGQLAPGLFRVSRCA